MLLSVAVVVVVLAVIVADGAGAATPGAGSSSTAKRESEQSVAAWEQVERDREADAELAELRAAAASQQAREDMMERLELARHMGVPLMERDPERHYEEFEEVMIMVLVDGIVVAVLTLSCLHYSAFFDCTGRGGIVSVRNRSVAS